MPLLDSPPWGEYVQVYYNLHRHCFSIADRRGRVCAHADVVALRDATFHVSQAGRQRVLRERQKNVHAKVRGHLVDPGECGMDALPCARAVRYNPYLYATFVFADTGEAALTAPFVVLAHRAIWVYEAASFPKG